MKFENVICQATQGLCSDEEQHESREADVHDDLTERDEETQTMASYENRWCQRDQLFRHAFAEPVEHGGPT